MNQDSGLRIDRLTAPTRDGWLLELKRTVSPAHLEKCGRPVLIIPGYGMNSFIFGYHPRGTSMERCLAESGFEVWSANLRGQGGSRPRDAHAPGPSMRAYADHDLPALLDKVLAESRQGAGSVDLIGCSLGGSIAYAHLALNPTSRVESLIAVGSPLRWTSIHPALKAAFASPWLAGKLVVRGARKVMRMGVGLLRHYPKLLSVYMNTEHVDINKIPEMIESVEDPYPRVNQDIARWISHGDMVLGGVNITDALASADVSDRPLLVVVSNRDGIVPEAANLSVVDAWGGGDVEILRVGTDGDWYAHADLFIGNDAPRAVFEPIAGWLHARAGKATVRR